MKKAPTSLDEGARVGGSESGGTVCVETVLLGFSPLLTEDFGKD